MRRTYQARPAWEFERAEARRQFVEATKAVLLGFVVGLLLWAAILAMLLAGQA